MSSRPHDSLLAFLRIHNSLPADRAEYEDGSRLQVAPDAAAWPRRPHWVPSQPQGMLRVPESANVEDKRGVNTFANIYRASRPFEVLPTGRTFGDSNGDSWFLDQIEDARQRLGGGGLGRLIAGGR